ncbi:acyl-CoA thioesterase [Methylophaga sp. 42_25_T18]|nr:acyl-CoA thioesterase [Methylophaga sp. 42_25_T18]
MQELPAEHAILRIMARPSDVNAQGDIFGGWLMSQVDIAGSIVATRHVKGRVVTVSANNFHFIRPVFVSDVVSIYGQIQKVGTSSILIDIAVYIERKAEGDVLVEKVADAEFVYVNIDKQGNPKPIKPS